MVGSEDGEIPEEVSEVTANNVPEGLSPQEMDLLRHYRTLSPNRQDLATRAIYSDSFTPRNFYDVARDLRVADDHTPLQLRKNFMPIQLNNSLQVAEIAGNFLNTVLQESHQPANFQGLTGLGNRQKDGVNALMQKRAEISNEDNFRRYYPGWSTNYEVNLRLVNERIENQGSIEFAHTNPAREDDKDAAALGFTSSSLGKDMKRTRPGKPLCVYGRQVGLVPVIGNKKTGGSRLPIEIQNERLNFANEHESSGYWDDEFYETVFAEDFDAKPNSTIGKKIIWVDINSAMCARSGTLGDTELLKLLNHIRGTMLQTVSMGEEASNISENRKKAAHDAINAQRDRMLKRKQEDAAREEAAQRAARKEEEEWRADGDRRRRGRRDSMMDERHERFGAHEQNNGYGHSNAHYDKDYDYENENETHLAAIDYSSEEPQPQQPRGPLPAAVGERAARTDRHGLGRGKFNRNDFEHINYDRIQGRELFPDGPKSRHLPEGYQERPIGPPRAPPRGGVPNRRRTGGNIITTARQTADEGVRGTQHQSSINSGIRNGIAPSNTMGVLSNARRGLETMDVNGRGASTVRQASNGASHGRGRGPGGDIYRLTESGRGGGRKRKDRSPFAAHDGSDWRGSKSARRR